MNPHSDNPAPAASTATRERLVDGLVESLAAGVPLPPDELRQRILPAVEGFLAVQARAWEDRLLRTERLATVGQLSAGVAHELRNPLSVIETSVYILSEHLAQDARAQRHLRRIGEQLALAGQIVNDLLDTARASAFERVPVDVAGLVRDALAQVPRPSGIAVELDLPAGLPGVTGDPRRLRQVFVNLLLNAFQAMTRGGHATISGRAEGRELVLRFEDTGQGIPPEALPRLFEPLVSTKPLGVGLGLSICRKIIEDHGGTLQAARSSSEGGACLVVTLPARMP